MASLLFSFRFLQFLSLTLCVLALLFSYFFMELHLGLEPCHLCIIDRLLFAFIAVVSLVGLVHNQGTLGGQRIYATVNILLSTSGIAVAGRHIYLQSQPADAVPDCIPGLGYMLENFPMLETLETIFTTSAQCTKVLWTFAGLTIPQQTLLLFIVLCTLATLSLLGTPNKKTQGAR